MVVHVDIFSERLEALVCFAVIVLGGKWHVHQQFQNKDNLQVFNHGGFVHNYVLTELNALCTDFPPPRVRDCSGGVVDVTGLSVQYLPTPKQASHQPLEGGPQGRRSVAELELPALFHTVS